MTNKRILTADVVVAFNDRTWRETNFTDPPKVVFEMDDRMDEEQYSSGAVRIRRYPALGAAGVYPLSDYLRIVTSEGALVRTNEIREKYVYGTLSVTGQLSYDLQYPVGSNLLAYVDGAVYDPKGNLIDVNMTFDAATNSLKFSKPCYCTVRYEYVTLYQIYRYFPDRYADMEVYMLPDQRDYGELIAFVSSSLTPKDPIVFQITPPDALNLEFELYRIESVAVATESGLWEKPQGWPTTGKFPSGEAPPNEWLADQLDSSASYVEVARVHEIAYFSLFNPATVRERVGSGAQVSALPLDYQKEALKANSRLVSKTAETTINDKVFDTTIRTLVRGLGQAYYDKYRQSLRAGATMRVERFQVPVAKPYDDFDHVKNSRTFEAVPRVMGSNSGSVRTGALMFITRDLSYKVGLSISAGRKPSVAVATDKNASNKDNRDFNTQGLRINTALSLVWEGIDWKALRRYIISTYDRDVYSLTFDSSFPSEN